jgi:uncharacterized membrane protein
VTSLLRVVGFVMIVAGLLLAASWFIEPLRQFWPLLLELPLPIRVGLMISGVGLLVVFSTVVYDRLHSNPDSLKEDLGEDS